MTDPQRPSQSGAEASVLDAKEFFARGYEVLVEVWSARIVHPKPTITLYLEKHGVTVNLADDYQHLEAILLNLLDKVRERQASEPLEADRG